MVDLTQRQLMILKAIIDEYIETASPVASETLDKKYNLGVSPATIRNEMVKLTQAGYLKQPHTSAGRVPTPVSMRFYVDKLMKQKELSVAEEVSVKQKIWDYRKEIDKLLREATKALAHQTKTMSLSATDEGDIFASGMGYILDMPEFLNIDLTRHFFDTLDEYDFWWSIFSKLGESKEYLSVLIGDDLKKKILNNCGGVFVYFQSSHHQGAIGVIGPSRLNYPKIIPSVKYVGDLINEIIKSW